MPSKITIRFYEVGKENANGLSLKEALKLVNKISEKGDRERLLTAGMTVRLERYEEDAGELAGEITRVRNTDFPYEVEADGVAPLSTEGPIGYGIAFRFRSSDHTLAIQYDPRIVSPGRLADYLAAIDPRGMFVITPKMDTANWRTFQKMPVRKLKVGVASPQHLGEIENSAASVAGALSTMAEAYEAPIVTVEISMGHRKGGLGQAAKNMAQEVFRLLKDGKADVRSLRARVATTEGEAAEDINLIDEVLSDRYEIALPKNDPDENYTIRKNLLKAKLNEHGK